MAHVRVMLAWRCSCDTLKPWTRAGCLNLNPHVIRSPSSDHRHQLKSKVDNPDPFPYNLDRLGHGHLVRCERECLCESGHGLGIVEGVGVVPLGPGKEGPNSELTYITRGL